MRLTSKFRFGEKSEPKVMIDYQNTTCLLTLNNPKAFNALNEEMLDIVNDELAKWETNKQYPQNLIIKSDHPKAFCAGGDVVSLVHMRNDNAPPEQLYRFFKTEFEVDYKLAQLSSKGVNTYALWDGIIMGGGVGISSGCMHRVATEKSLFAMPETRIGLFVDVAISYYLTKLEGDVGRYLALLGHRLKGSQVHLTGLANAFLPHEQIANLQQMIIEKDPKEVAQFLQDKTNQPTVNREEVLDWVALRCVVSEVFSRTGQDTSRLIHAHEECLEQVTAKKLDLSKTLNQLSSELPESLKKGGSSGKSQY